MLHRASSVAVALALGASSVLAQRPAPKYLTPAQRAALDADIAKAMRDYAGVPGLSVAVVQGDSVIYAKGFGVRERGKPEPVTDHTLFAIGSNTKSMTAALVGTLVDEGKMRWNDPVWTYLPNFRVADPYVSREATIRDLLSHRVDVENNLSAWYRSSLSRAELVARLRFLKQDASFRSKFLYNNLMVMTAGEAAAAAGGKSWNALLRERLFVPLGMTASLTGSRELTADADVAAPHVPFNGALVPIAHVDADNIGPAGSVYSNAVDMAQYLRFQIGRGAIGGKRVLSEGSIAQIRTLTTPIGAWQATVPDSDVVVQGYGLGWLVQSFRGHRAIRHNGSIDGYLAEMQVLPDDGVGVVVLSNQMTLPLPEAVANHILDVALGLTPRDWIGQALANDRKQEALLAERRRAQEAQRTPGAAPSLPLGAYAGTYADSLRGEIRVALEEGKLVLRYQGTLAAELEPWQRDTFRAVWRTPNVYALSPMLVTFTVDASGRATDVANALLGTFHVAPKARTTASGGER